MTGRPRRSRITDEQAYEKGWRAGVEDAASDQSYAAGDPDACDRFVARHGWSQQDVFLAGFHDSRLGRPKHSSWSPTLGFSAGRPLDPIGSSGASS